MGKSYQKVIADKKHKMLAEATMSLYDTSLSIKQNLEVMQTFGIKISLSTLKRILKEKGIIKKRKREEAISSIEA